MGLKHTVNKEKKKEVKGKPPFLTTAGNQELLAFVIVVRGVFAIGVRAWGRALPTEA